MAASTILPGVYEHYKSNRYLVLGIAKHTETEEPHVVYRSLYGTGEAWIRPLSMFSEEVKIDGVLRPRFRLVRCIRRDEDLVRAYLSAVDDARNPD